MDDEVAGVQPEADDEDRDEGEDAADGPDDGRVCLGVDDGVIMRESHGCRLVFLIVPSFECRDRYWGGSSKRIRISRSTHEAPRLGEPWCEILLLAGIRMGSRGARLILSLRPAGIRETGDSHSQQPGSFMCGPRRRSVARTKNCR